MGLRGQNHVKSKVSALFQHSTVEIYIRDSAHLCLSLISMLPNIVSQNKLNSCIGCHGIVARTPDSGSVGPGSNPLRGLFYCFADF